ncbi:MAG: VCBS domain-containing protein [Gammaproteobacteria bacterium]|nr:VCBS domain-containing protein [Gammaproteobacteria bacterium]
MAAKIIGHIAQIEGTVNVRSEKGELNKVSAGDKLHEGDVLVTGAGAEVSVKFLDGHELKIGSNAEVLLDETVGNTNNLTAEQAQKTPVQNADATNNETSQNISTTENSYPSLPSNNSRNLIPEFENISSTARARKSIYGRVGDEGGVDSKSTPIYERSGEEGGVNTRNSEFGIDTSIPDSDDSKTVDTRATEFDIVTSPDIFVPPIFVPPTPVTDDTNGFSVNDVSISEGGLMTFTVTRTGDAAADQTIDFATSIELGNSAEAIDFTPNNNTLTFAKGVTSQTFTVQTTQDAIYEGDETFTVTLSNNSVGSTIIDSTGIGTIIDDGTGPGPYPAPTPYPDDDLTGFSVDDVSISEGGLMTFTVTRTGDAEADQTIDFATSIELGNSAEAVDFTPNNNTLTFAQGVTSQTFTVQTTQDATYEGDETFTVTLSNNSVGSTIIDSTGIGTIIDDGTGPGPYPAPTPYPDDDLTGFSVDDVSISEGGLMTFTVTRTGDAEADQTIDFATSIETGDSTEAIDFTPNNNTLTFAKGVTSQTFTVQTTQDAIYEGDETFTVTLSNNSVGSTIIDSTGIGTIIDDGTGPGPYPAPTPYPDNDLTGFSVDDVSISEGGLMTFTVTRTGDAEADQTIDFATSIELGNSAEAIDFTPNNNTLTFAKGVTSQTFTVQTTQDAIYEGAETFTVTLSNNSAGSSITDGTGIGTIIDDGTGPGPYPAPTPYPDDDKPVVSITSSNTDAVEGTSNDTVSFIVSQSNESNFDTTVTVTLDLGTVEAADLNATVTYLDATGNAATTTITDLLNGLDITIPANSSYAPEFIITALDDTVFEKSETLTMSIALAVGETDASIHATDNSVDATIYDEDSTVPTDPIPGDELGDRPLLSIAPTSLGSTDVTEGNYAYFTLTRTGETEIAGTATVSIVHQGTNVTVDADFGDGSTYTIEYYDTDTSSWRDAISGVPVGTSGATATVDLRVMTNIDGSLEGVENFTMDITAATNMTVDIANDSAAGTIDDNTSGPPIITIPDNTDDALGAVTVDDEKVLEAGLADGTDSEILTDKTFTVFVPDGVKSIIIGGTEVVNNAGTFTASVINTGEGSIHVTAYDPGTGVFTYTYTLGSAQDHGDDTTDVIDSITIAVEDDNGVTASDTLDILIVDDVPTAIADTNSVAENSVSITDNVFDSSNNAQDDTIGADVTATPVTAVEEATGSTLGAVNGNTIGLYGTLALNDNGTYIYTLDNNNVTVNALADLDSLTETFNYTITDADGDTSTTTLTITITGTNDAPVLDLDANDSTTTGSDFITAYALGATGVSIGDVDVSVTDVDSDFIESATVTLTNQQLNDILFAGDMPSGITATVNAANNTVTLISDVVGTMTLADYETAIEAINFYNADTGASSVDRTVTVVVNDGTSNSNTATTTITVASNALSISAPETVEEGRSAVFIVELAEPRSIDTVISLDISGVATLVDGDYESIYYYESAPGVWEPVVGDSITILAGETSVAIKIRTISEDPAVPDDGESLILEGTITNDPNADNNADMANTVASAGTIITEYPSIWVSAPTSISEGDAGIFEVGFTSTTANSTDVVLTLSGEAVAADYNAIIEISFNDGSTYTQTISNGGTVTVPAGTGTIMVRVTTLSGDAIEGDESLVLTATTTATHISPAGQSASDDTVIVEPLALTATEEKDTFGDTNYIAPVTDTATAPTGYIYERVGDAANGTVEQSGDNLIYTANTDFSGPDTFSFIKINTATGERTEGLANVTVTAVADTPDITMSVNNQTSSSAPDTTVNGDLNSPTLLGSNATNNELTNGNWYAKASPGSSGKFASASDSNVVTEADGSGGDRAVIANEMLLQGYNITTASDIDLTFTVTGTGTVNIYWNATAEDDNNVYLILKDGTAVLESSLATNDSRLADNAYSAGTYTVTVPASVQLNTADALLVDSGLTDPGLNTLIFYADSTGVAIDDVSTILSNSTTFTYDVNITASVTDTVTYDVNDDGDLLDVTDEYEFLQDAYTLTGAPASATFTNTAGDVLDSANHLSGGVWTFTEAEILGLKMTVSQSDAGTPGFTLTAGTTSEENVGGSTATNTASVTVLDTNDTPSIGDNALIMANEANFSGELLATLKTHFSTDPGTINTFAWDETASTLPVIYADGQIVDIVFNADGTITGTIDNGATAIFTVTIVLIDGVSTVQYVQNGELLGVKETFDGGIELPGGGNSDSIVLGFNGTNTSGSIYLSDIDAIIVAHNLIDDTAAEIADANAEHTVNTNNIYIGVDSNNMNPGDQLIMDFATAGVFINGVDDTDGVTHANEVVEMELSLFNFGSEKSGDELFITVITLDAAGNEVRETIVLLGDSSITNQLYTLTAPSGEMFVGVEFLAGNESSFKLGINSISGIEYNSDFDMTLGYSITDSDGDSDSGKVLISMDGDESIVYDSSKTAIDAGVDLADGADDTLVFNSGDSIDFSLDTNPDILNFEIIDLTNNADNTDTGIPAAHSLTNLSWQDVLDMTDSSNDLKILGDTADNVSIINTGVWSASASALNADGNTYVTYTNTADPSMNLLIESTVNVSII